MCTPLVTSGNKSLKLKALVSSNDKFLKGILQIIHIMVGRKPAADANGCQKSVAPIISENFEFFDEILTHFECTKCHKSMPTPLGFR